MRLTLKGPVLPDLTENGSVYVPLFAGDVLVAGPLQNTLVHNLAWLGHL